MSGGELDHHQLCHVATPEKFQRRANEDLMSKEGAESNSLQSTGKDTNASFTGSNSTGTAENRPSLKNILMMINNQKPGQRTNQSTRQSLLDHPTLVKLSSIASVSSTNAGKMDPTSLQAQMANIVDSNPFEDADDCSSMLAPIMPLEKIQSLCDDQVRKSCLAHCAREQERAIERNLQWVLQSEVNSSHQGDNEIDGILQGEDNESDTGGFELPLNQELLGVGGRGLRDSDSLNDELEDQDQDEVVYAELLLNTLMRERSEVFGQAEKSLLYRSMLNQKKADNMTAGPKFITSDQQVQAEKDENDNFEDDQLFQQAADAQLLNQKANSGGSKFDTNRYFKPTVAPVNENLFPQSFQALSQLQYQQLNQQQWADGPFAPMAGFLPQMQNLMMPDPQQYDQNEQFEQVEQVNIGKGVATKPQSKSKISPSQKIFLPKVRFECCEKLNKVDVSCECILIDKVSQLEILDEILTLPQDEIVGINVQMNADVVNENFQIDVFGPSLLTLGTSFKTYIIDFVKLSTLNNQKALDGKLCHIFQQAHIIFAGFGVPTMITYFHQFHQNFCFLRYVPRIIDVRIMYHKVQRKGQRSFATIYQILFAKRLDITENLSDWEQRPLTANQLKQTGVEVQSLLRMIYKLDRLSKTKDKARFRVYMHEIISKVENFHYIDNPLVYNKFTKADLKISAMNRRIKLSKPQIGKSQKKEQHKDSKAVKNQPQKNAMPAPPQIATEQDNLQQAQEQLRLFELVEQMTGVKMMPPAGQAVEPFQQAFPKKQNLVQGMPQAQYVPDRQQLYGNYVPVHPVQVAPLAPMMPQQQPVQMHAGSNGNFPYVPQVPGAAAQSMQVLDSQVCDPGSRESSFTEKNLARIQPFSPHKNSQSANNSFFQDSAGEKTQPGQINFSSIYEEMQDINKFQRKDSNQSYKQSQKEQSEIQNAALSSKQQPKSKSGVVANQKSGQERKGADGGAKSQNFTERKSDDKKFGSVTSSDRHVFRKKQKSQVSSLDAGDDSNQQFIAIQQHAKHIQNEQRKLSKEARAREKKIMQEQHKRKNEGQDKKGKAPVKSARVTPMSAASLQQQTGFPVQVKQRQKRQKAQVKEPTTEQDERLQRQALADQKRRMIKELQEREQALQKQNSETTQNSEDKGESEQQA